MRSFLERYRAGECVAVWRELTALGADARHELYYKDVCAVADETMRRARRNVETIIRRLDAIGYRFTDESSFAQEEIGRIANSRRILTGIEARLTKAIENAAPELKPRGEAALARARARRERMEARFAEREAECAKISRYTRKASLDNKFVFSPPSKAVSGELAKLEKAAGGSMPISLRSWFRQVGGVSLLGSHPVLNPKPSYENCLPDPLVIASLAELLHECAVGADSGNQLLLTISPDALSKANISGDAYYLRLPDRGADFRFEDRRKQTFVNYLRRTFEWGGFPGWQRAKHPPRAEIAMLTEGLLPL